MGKPNKSGRKAPRARRLAESGSREAPGKVLRPILVGELNPRDSDPRLALYPVPLSGAGGRLCHKVMGLSPEEYLTRFDRVNLCAGEWDPEAAEQRASELLDARPRGGRVLVLLGRKVAMAFGFSRTDDAFTVSPRSDSRRYTYVLLPHPSGLCREWNEPGNFARARRALRVAGVL